MQNFEWDLLLMSLVIFVPSGAAILLLFVPHSREALMSWFARIGVPSRVAAMLVRFIPSGEEWMRFIALIGTAVTLALSIFMFIDYYRDVPDFYVNHPEHSTLNHRAEIADKAHAETRSEGLSGHNWLARRSWISSFHIDYYLGVDGISMPLVLLTTVLSFLAMIASWKIDRFVRGYCMLFLILETGMLGTFLALDFFLFYIFWEVMLLPMYFLIGVWGGPRREYAAIKFFLYTLLGSVFILIALLGFYFTDVRDFAVSVTKPGEAKPEEKHTFDMVLLQKVGSAARVYLNADGQNADAVLKDPRFGNEEVRAGGTALDEARTRLQKQSGSFGFFSKPFQYTMFLLLLIGFAIKVPVFPFHTWLPDAHVEAPTPISMILAGVLLKMGGYGILRIAYPICPWAAETLAWYVALFGIINIVYGAFAAMAQTDFKKLVAYSSISHMGYVLLGIAVWTAPDRSQYWDWGMNGAMFQMIAHGITSAGMFFLVGVIYDRAHHRDLNNFRGLYEPMPLYGGISAIIFFAAMGLPGMCGFVGEFMVVLATWNYSQTFSILAALTVVITAAYILWTLQRVFLGQNPAYQGYSDITPRELLCIVPLVILAILLGVAPNLLLSWMEPSLNELVKALGQVASLR